MQIYEMEPYEFYVEHLDKTEDENGYQFTLIPVNVMDECPCCGSANIIRYGTKTRNVRDINMFAKMVGLVIKNIRYKCKDCNETFTNSFQSIDDSNKITVRLKEYIREQSIKRPFLNIADELGTTDTTIKRIFMDYVAELDKSRILKAPEVLGIDENHLKKQYRAVFTDIKNGTILEILPNRSKEAVKKFSVKESSGKP